MNLATIGRSSERRSRLITLSVLTCKNDECQYDILLQRSFVREIFSHSRLVHAGNEILNFVCHHCGSGNRYYPSELREQEFSFDPYALADGQSVFHESLRCVEEQCSTHARVHTMATNGCADAAPTKPLAEWQLHGITCCDGHQVREPLKVVAKLRSRVA